MKVLFVCVDRYPYDGACTNLLKKLFFAGRMLDHDLEIHIASYRYSFKDEPYEKASGVTVHRLLSPYFLTASDLIKHFYRFDLLIRGGVSKLQERKRSAKPNSRELRKEQIREYERYLRKLCKAEHYEALVGVAGSYEMAIAAKIISTEFGIPYILYQVDPFTDNETFTNHTAHHRLQTEIELYTCAKKIFTTELILSKMKGRLDAEALSKVEVMEFPGVSVDTSIEKKTDFPKNGDNIDCVFAGRVYAGIRNPTFTIDLFRRLPERINLKLYGVTRKELERLFSISSLPNNVACFGLVSVEEAEKAMQNADILVNIGNIMMNQVPSKLFSYISTGKPILNICVNQDCPSKKYLEQYPYALSINEEPTCSDCMIQEVSDFVTENAGRVCDLREIAVLYEKCTPAYAARQMEAAFYLIENNK